jgi:hypothetical protein
MVIHLELITDIALVVMLIAVLVRLSDLRTQVQILSKKVDSLKKEKNQ